jgi:hypothetical protein
VFLSTPPAVGDRSMDIPTSLSGSAPTARLLLRSGLCSLLAFRLRSLGAGMRLGALALGCNWFEYSPREGCLHRLNLRSRLSPGMYLGAFLLAREFLDTTYMIIAIDTRMRTMIEIYTMSATSSIWFWGQAGSYNDYHCGALAGAVRG